MAVVNILLEFFFKDVSDVQRSRHEVPNLFRFVLVYLYFVRMRCLKSVTYLPLSF